MKTRLLTVSCLALLLSLTSCALIPQQKLHPPAWTWGDWGTGAEPETVLFTISATTVVQRSGSVSMDLGELYRLGKMPVTETITSSLYSFTQTNQTGYTTYEFTYVDANTINCTLRTNVYAVGPTPLHRL